MSNDSINSILNTLSEKERKYALEILKEYSDKGSSETYNNLIYEDYEEVPVDITEFLHNPIYLGKALTNEEGKFTIDDVIQGLYDKLHRRHPHVFGAHAHAATPEEALALWKEMKKKERAQK